MGEGPGPGRNRQSAPPGLDSGTLRFYPGYVVKYVLGGTPMTTLVRWDPLREAAAMHTELSRLMNGLSEGTGRQTQAWVPTLDVWETADALHYAFDLPGIPKDKIAIEVEDGTLSVSATREREQQVEGGGYQRFERRYGTFARTVGLPQGVSEEQIKA